MEFLIFCSLEPPIGRSVCSTIMNNHFTDKIYFTVNKRTSKIEERTTKKSIEQIGKLVKRSTWLW
ncbi:hypothetical protein CJ030_MR3G001163 [Morella rubra]|uniref:Uncharacterized protein n=1 Tax=Morella rubra TaxID=262757 RepID=A0A6A1W284_9ROSI|nr:hypothetical protein CJ030_MR3G001163 [Morella rubra]